MSRAVISKTFRDYALLWSTAIVLLAAFVVLFMTAIQSIPMEQGLKWLELPWVRRLITALLGSDLLENMNPTGLVSFAFGHPLVWTLLVAFILTTTSGVLAGEVDHGTMDLIASLPITRTRLYASLTAVIVAMCLPLCWAVWGGAAIGRFTTDAPDVDLAALARLTWHLYGCTVYLTCFALAISAMCSRRSTAASVCFLLVFCAFVLNFIVAIWPAAGRIAFTGFLHYYAPLPIVRDPAWRWGDLGVLLGAGAAWWIIGLVVFQRRDFRAT